MTVKSIDAALMRKLFLAGAQAIDSEKDVINELNVFPVPDGDTGTNMTMTIMSAAREVNALQDPGMGELAKAISSGSLRGARGNSGVILSQLLRGFTKVIRDYNEITVDVVSAAFTKAVETAYKAVMKPKEGTILTVAKGGAEKAAELVGQTEDLVEFVGKIIEHMEEVLALTPELLPVLKEAGVVDSGGQGLVVIMKGGYDVLCGKEFSFTGESTPTVPASSERGPVNTENISTADIKFGYCTEFIILLEKEFGEQEERKFKAFLESIGDSIVCVADDEVVKVHVHTNHPGKAFEKGLEYGQLTKMKVDNMREEHNEKLFLEQEKAQAANGAAPAPAAEEPKPAEPRKPVGFIAVSIGEGINEIFNGLGVDYLIEGGQTMNPSTEDMLTAIEKVNAENIFILPNNGNVILAATQAKSLVEDKKIFVIPSKTAPQGISAMVSFLADKSAEENEAMMTEALGYVKSGEVTYAVRDTSFEGKEIREGDIMGISDKGIQTVGQDIAEVTVKLADELVDEDSGLVSIYFGADATEEDAQAIADTIGEQHPDLDVEVHFGGQPVYYYLLSVE